MRKRSKNAVRKDIKFGTGEPLSYGSKWNLPRPQERVPRSLSRPLMPSRKDGMTAFERSVANARLFSQLYRDFAYRRSAGLPKLTPVRKVPVARVAAPMRSRFVFRSPFARQYRQLKAAGAMVANPSRVLFCVKRKVRREVLFAFRRVGFGGSSGGRRNTYVRNANSLHGC